MQSGTLPEDIHLAIQGIFRSTPAILIGSGFSCGYGMPGMWHLGEHLSNTVGPRLQDADAIALWARSIEAVKHDLEKGLNTIATGDRGRELVVSIVREETASFISERTYEAEEAILAAAETIDHAPARLLRRLFHGAPQNTDCIPVITTNYDTLLELFCDIASLPVDTGFTGFRHRWARQPPTFPTHYRRTVVTKHKGGSLYDHSPYLTIKLLKPHGSINWRSSTKGPIEVLHNYSAGPKSIVIPGPSKYEDSLVNTLFDSVRTEMNSSITKAHALVAIGYGFNDQHLQGIIESRLAAHMPTIIITRELTPATEALLLRYPHIIAVCMKADGSVCHHNREIHYSDLPLWQLDDFLRHFLE
ncbi:SIR2 family protein [Methylobacterium goesingense]|uniref:SIR2-like domain-containing protein n=1 Tax=Methylobacterium goesingense TaxID=243690 RepID=A0ABV2LB83_9HYPH|nr:SIR2 family protein [Methylobacterium goesingense]GJD75763.1 hypothetical protein CFIICLFH_4008 [Methylobacterium goesingense]